MSKNLIIIDDDPIYRMIASKMIHLIDSSVTIHQCEDGEKGLSKLQSLEKSDLNSIVLLDINMPRLNGWGVLKALEESNVENLNQLTIYIVSSSTDESDILKSNAFKLVKGFVTKPLSEKNIKSILK